MGKSQCDIASHETHAFIACYMFPKPIHVLPVLGCDLIAPMPWKRTSAPFCPHQDLHILREQWRAVEAYEEDGPARPQALQVLFCTVVLVDLAICVLAASMRTTQFVNSRMNEGATSAP